MIIKEYRNKDTGYTINNGESDYLSNLKKINIFVGANNSGKSRFLRRMFMGGHDDFVFFDDMNKELKQIFDNLNEMFSAHFSMADLQALISSKTGDYATRFNDFYRKIDGIKEEHSRIGNVSDYGVASSIKRDMQQIGIYKEISNSKKIGRRHIYIPILRGLRHLDFQNDLNNKQDLYQIRTKEDYKLNIEENKNREVFTGLSIYAEIKKMLLGSRENRQFIKEFENFLSESFFKGRNITLIPDHDTDTLKININDTDDREIYNVGDGIQSIIINTFQAFKYQNENLILFIEEPEVMMHPSIQRVLIEKLTTKFDKLQIFLTTHSNHFLDLTYDYPDDVAIFSFEKISNEKFNIKNIVNNSIILDLLGIRNSSVFLSNCVIWTEGVTDRMFLRKLLEIKNIKYKEDYHYSFAEYGGSNLENFDFIDMDTPEGVNIQAITKRNYLIVDNDNIKGNTQRGRKNLKYIRRQKIKAVLGGANFFDSHIEIENLVPYKVWSEVINNLLKDKPDKIINLKRAKDNDEINFNKNLKNKKIGHLIKKYLIEIKDGNIPKYFNDNSIQCLGETKKEIMKYVCRALDKLKLQFSDFPRETQKLINSLNNFIKISNTK